MAYIDELCADARQAYRRKGAIEDVIDRGLRLEEPHDRRLLYDTLVAITREDIEHNHERIRSRVPLEPLTERKIRYQAEEVVNVAIRSMLRRYDAKASFVKPWQEIVNPEIPLIDV